MLVLVIGLVLVTQAVAFLLVSVATTRNATRQIAASLDAGAGVFRRLIDERSAGLVGNARLLSGDFAFKQAFASDDHGTILSAMENHLQRIEADTMILVDPDGRVIASTVSVGAQGSRAPWDGLLARASADDYGEGSGIVEIGGVLQQVTVVPLFTPEPSAWILFGFAIDDAFARALGKISEVSVLSRRSDGSWDAVASTMAPATRDALVKALGHAPAGTGVRTESLAGEDYVLLPATLDPRAEMDAVAVLARSLRAELAPYRRLMASLAALLGAGVAVAVVAAVLIARSVTGPVLELARGVRRIAGGDYAGRMDIPGRDEISELSQSFNQMAGGLEDRERVRALLGRVVSPAIAEELLRRPIQLGGEEREVTVLFVDIRGFTARCEGTSPAEVLALLNRYLTRVTEAIEAEGGVVDKYIGDAVMAVFGSPVTYPDHARRAVRAAIGMAREAAAFTEWMQHRFPDRGLPVFGIGVGMHTGEAVIGDIGTPKRKEFTAIGDTVNAASRLEGVTKELKCVIAASEATIVAAGEGIRNGKRESVTVKGRAEPITVFEVLDMSG